MRLTIFSLYVVPGSKSCASQSRITNFLLAATGIDCRRPSATNARSTLPRLVGRIGELGRRRASVRLTGRSLKRIADDAEPIVTADDEAGFDELAKSLGDLCRSKAGRRDDPVDVQRAELDRSDNPSAMCIGQQPDQRGRVEVGHDQYPRSGYTAPCSDLPCANRRILVVMRSDSSGSSISSVAPM